MRLVLILFFIAFTAHANGPIHHFTLNNGLKILVKEDHRAQVAVTMLFYNVGSADEPGGLTGVSHALEHLMFKATRKYPSGMFSKTIAALGGQENAMTNYDYTAYYEQTAASELPAILALEAQRMQHLQFDATEFAKEMNVIREERQLRTDNNPQALTFERYLAASQLSAPYHHPIIGWMSDLQQMRLKDVKTWYQLFYTPNNATLVIVGDVDPVQVQSLAALYFEKIPRGPDFIRKKQTEPPALGPKSLRVHAAAQVPVLLFGYTVPGVTTAEQAWEPYALEIINGILDAGTHARFSKNLVRNRHIASSADVYYNLYTRYQSQIIFYGTPTQTHTVSDLQQAIGKELKRLQQEKVSETELTRVKTQIIAQKTFEQDSFFNQAMELGLFNILNLPESSTEIYLENIKKITPQQIQDAAQRYFREEAMTKAVLYPDNKEKQ